MNADYNKHKQRSNTELTRNPS